MNTPRVIPYYCLHGLYVALTGCFSLHTLPAPVARGMGPINGMGVKV